MSAGHALGGAGSWEAAGVALGAGEDASLAVGAGALVARSFVAHAASINANGAKRPARHTE